MAEDSPKPRHVIEFMGATFIVVAEGEEAERIAAAARADAEARLQEIAELDFVALRAAGRSVGDIAIGIARVALDGSEVGRRPGPPDPPEPRFAGRENRPVGRSEEVNAARDADQQERRSEALRHIRNDPPEAAPFA